jgi:hypothetical protein
VKPAGKFSWIPRDMLATIAMSAQEKIVWLAVNSYANEDAECFASITHIAERCGCSKSSVQRSLPILVKSGWLLVMVQASHKPTRYKLLQPTIVNETIVNETIVNETIVNQTIVEAKKKSQTDEVPPTIPTLTIVNETIVPQPTIVRLNTDYSLPDTLSRTNEVEPVVPNTKRRPPTPTKPKVVYSITFDYDTGEFVMTEAARQKLDRDWPDVDVDVEIRKAEGWVLDVYNKDKRVIQNGLSFLGKWMGKPSAQRKAAGKVTLNSGALAGKTVTIGYGGQVQKDKRPAPVMDLTTMLKGD